MLDLAALAITSGTSGASSVSSVDASWSATIAGDLIVVGVVVPSGATLTTPSGGWAQAVQQTTAARLAVYLLAASGGETGVSVAMSAARPAAWVAAVVTRSLVAATQPDVTAVSAGANVASTTRSSGTSGTTTQADVACLAIHGTLRTDAGGAPDLTSWTNSFAEQVDTGSTTTGANDVRLFLSTRFPGAVGTYETTGTQASVSTSRSSGTLTIVRGASAASPALISSAAVVRASTW